MRLKDFRVLTFDCYGTLIDWEGGILAGLKPLTERLNREISDNGILESHALLESRQQRTTPGMRYADLLATVYRRLAEEWGRPAPWEDCEAYGKSVWNWPVFPDTVAALRYLKQHFRLVILSNVDNASFAASNEKLGVEFDAVFTAQDIGSYKPAKGNFEYMLGNLARAGFTKANILHVAESLYHDHAPANELAISSCRIYRRRGKEGFGASMSPQAMPSCNFIFDSMQELAATHARDCGS
jgi:2-haloalkanoic acid dehalogenase type II